MTLTTDTPTAAAAATAGADFVAGARLDAAHEAAARAAGLLPD